MPVDGIPESKPIGDRDPDRPDHARGGFAEREAEPRRLLAGRDEADFAPGPDEAREILCRCLLDGIRDELGLPLGPAPGAGPWPRAVDAEAVADRLVAEASALLLDAEAQGLEDPYTRMRTGAERGLAQGFALLERLGAQVHALDPLVVAWAARAPVLARAADEA